MSTARVLVACDRIGDLDPLAAGRAIASGFATVAQVALLPVAAQGRDLPAALAALVSAEVHEDGPGWWLASGELLVAGYTQPPGPAWQPQASTSDLGEWLRAVLAGHDGGRVVLDLTGVSAHDAGAGLLAAAGPVLAGRQLDGLVRSAELDVPALGATGMLARRAHGAGVDLSDLLAADAGLRAWVEAHAPGQGSVPGSGAGGGTALVVLAAGGELITPTQFCYRLAGAASTVRAANLVVTGCTDLSALDRGGDVVSAVAGWADEAERPCIAFTTGTGLARRELRTFGLEAAHAVGVPVTPGGLEAVAARIAAGWFPGGGGSDVH